MRSAQSIRSHYWRVVLRLFRWPRAAWRRAQLPVARLSWGPDWIVYGFENSVRAIAMDGPGRSFDVPDPIISGLTYWHTTPPRRIFRMTSAVYLPSLGALACNGAVIRESYGMSWIPPHPRLPGLDRAEPVESSSPFVPVNHTTYYHFVVEELPAALRARDAQGDVTALVPADAPPYQFEALSTMGLRPIGIPEPMRVQDCLVVERGSESGWPRPDDVDRLRRELGPWTHSPGRHVYVSRSGSSRSLGQEPEIESLLASSGIDVIHCERLSWGEQVQLFKQVAVLIGPHGAGLTNAILMPHGGTVVELVDRGYFNPCFGVLCGLIGHQHSVLDVRNRSSHAIAATILEIAGS